MDLCSRTEWYPQFNCPCAKYPGPSPPIFVSSHYYYESGNTGTHDGEFTIYDTLWDGVGCLPQNSCCYDSGKLWFFCQFPIATTGDIEVRICYDEGFANETVAVKQIQLCVQ